MLLDEDGKESFGVKIVFSLFAAMAVAEMETKKARFKRSKDRNKLQGRKNGGTTLFGYTTDSNGFFVIQKDEAAMVRMICKMYATGQYSIESLAQELISQGYTIKGKKPNPVTIGNWLRFGDSYLGVGDIKYPQILDQELVDKVRTQRKDAIKKTPRASKRIFFASKLLKCQCGRYLCGSVHSYACSSTILKKRRMMLGQDVCEYGIHPSIAMVDGLLWRVARQIHMERLGELSKERVNETKSEINILAKKITVLNDKVAEFETKKKRLTSAYVLGDFNDEEYADLKNKLLVGHAQLLNQQMSLVDRYTSLMQFLDENSVCVGDPEEAIRDIEARNDRKELNEIIHKYITGGTVRRAEYDGFKAFEVEIVSVIGVRKFMYLAHRKNGERLFEI